MNQAEGNPGVNKLARVIKSRMTRERDAYSSLILDFGVIQEDYSLKTNTFPKPIPKTDYMVCRHLTVGEVGSHLTFTVSGGNQNDGTHSHGSSGDHVHDGGEHGGHLGGSGSHSHVGGAHFHSDEAPHIHDVLIPEKMRKLLPGDRVLVAWVQNDAVVIDLILPASVL